MAQISNSWMKHYSGYHQIYTKKSDCRPKFSSISRILVWNRTGTVRLQCLPARTVSDKRLSSCHGHLGYCPNIIVFQKVIFHTHLRYGSVSYWEFPICTLRFRGWWIHICASFALPCRPGAQRLTCPRGVGFSIFCFLKSRCWGSGSCTVRSMMSVTRLV